MSITAFISAQPQEWQELLTQLHEVIIQKDKTVVAGIAPMMGKEMIIYNAPGSFKYALSGGKKQMSLHVLPMYMLPALYDKYKILMPAASFQKGCINFNNKDQMPLKIVKQLIAACAPVDLAAIRANQLKSKAKKS